MNDQLISITAVKLQTFMNSYNNHKNCMKNWIPTLFFGNGLVEKETFNSASELIAEIIESISK